MGLGRASLEATCRKSRTTNERLNVDFRAPKPKPSPAFPHPLPKNFTKNNLFLACTYNCPTPPVNLGPLMNPNHTEIAFILDRSGSMASMVEPAIAGFNSLLSEQQTLPGSARFSLVLFDDHYEVPVASMPIAEVQPLNTNTYQPRGSTALLDTIGRTIDELGARLANAPEAERPGQVLVAILTDGEENASRQFTWKDISDRIRHQTDVYQWRFLFLGANQDAIATASRMSIGRENSANFAMDEDSYQSGKNALNRKMKAMRLYAQGKRDTDTLDDMDMELEKLRMMEEAKIRGRKK